MKNAYSIRRKKRKGTKKSKIAKIISSINIGCCCFLACFKNKGWYMFSQMYIVVDVCLKNKAYSQDISCEIDGKSFYALSYFSSLPPFGVSIVLVCVLYLQHLSPLSLFVYSCSIGDSTVIIFISMCIILHLTNFWYRWNVIRRLKYTQHKKGKKMRAHKVL